jgi:hypothetical protein
MTKKVCAAAIRELADLTAELIRRAGTAYGPSEDWRNGFTRAVKVSESMSRELAAIAAICEPPRD